MKINGIDEVIREINRAKRDILQAMNRGVQKTAEAVLDEVKARTARPFQEVPSYLLEHRFRSDIGARKYPDDTPATFAKATSAGFRREVTRIGNLFAGGPKDLPIQQYPIGDHYLHEELRMRDAKVEESVSRASVGYPGGVPKYVYWVYYGTRGHRVGPHGRREGAMVGRPFLEDALANHRKALVKNIADEIRKSFEDAKTASQQAQRAESVKSVGKFTPSGTFVSK